MSNNNESIDEELRRIKAEMSDIKELLKEKQSNSTDDDDRDWRSERGPRFSFDGINFDRNKIDLDRVGETLDDFVENLTSSIDQNLEKSIRQMVQGFKHQAREMERQAKAFEREQRRHARHTRHASNRRYAPLSEEELPEFYEIAPKLMTTLADERRLRILKMLEEGPAKQSDIADKIDAKGGSLKHHLDSLIENKFVVQEKVRGRYEITTHGVEALRLVEVLFRRQKFEKSNDVQVNVDVDFNEDGPEAPETTEVAFDTEEQPEVFEFQEEKDQ